jgi:phosphoglycolate phosphatase-like HAD superfamily hydrolase
MYFFFDFDGTLLDISEKFYTTYADILKRHSQNTLDKSLYWELKRNKTPEPIIHSITDAYVENFKEIRKSIIETNEYQRFDKIHSGVVDVLKYAKKKGNVYLVTLRHSHLQVINQLNKLNISQYFDCVLSSGDTENTAGWKVKYSLLNKHFNGSFPKDSFFVGDTETDILTGKKIEAKTIAVLNGMRNFEKLSKENPNYLVPSIADIIHLI